MYSSSSLSTRAAQHARHRAPLLRPPLRAVGHSVLQPAGTLPIRRLRDCAQKHAARSCECRGKRMFRGKGPRTGPGEAAGLVGAEAAAVLRPLRVKPPQVVPVDIHARRQIAARRRLSLPITTPRRLCREGGCLGARVDVVLEDVHPVLDEHRPVHVLRRVARRLPPRPRRARAVDRRLRRLTAPSGSACLHCQHAFVESERRQLTEAFCLTTTMSDL